MQVKIQIRRKGSQHLLEMNWHQYNQLFCVNRSRNDSLVLRLRELNPSGLRGAKGMLFTQPRAKFIGHLCIHLVMGLLLQTERTRGISGRKSSHYYLGRRGRGLFPTWAAAATTARCLMGNRSSWVACSEWGITHAMTILLMTTVLVCLFWKAFPYKRI